ncbi:MAG: tRNA preQ1(34) S-adenosylmethionine ribosyltransferase-isomerase QueA [Patescibacteria group bacterium]|jgi:S-adenosylmethionine:tRNA ribosyltransferase-isomerase
MKLSDFNYNLPSDLIAQEPVSPRDHSRLLIYNRRTQKINHQKFYDIVDYLNPGDVLFVNNSKVFSARLKAHKKTGGEVEIFLLKNISQEKNIWQCLIGGRVKDGAELVLPDNLIATIIKNDEQIFGDDKNDNNDNNGVRQVIFNKNYQDFLKIIEKIGWTPLPPYIKREERNQNDIKNYQTVYAQDDKIGSSAVPTAGLHFTDELLKKIKSKGIEILEGTLHVGLGTFSPIKTENILDHQMHSEEAEVSQEVLLKIIEAKKEGRRIIAVGTTSVRILESLAQGSAGSSFYWSDKKRDAGATGILVDPITFSTNIFIYPGFKFQMVDGLITNFHLPQSSLIVLISALIGREKTLEIYQEAINEKYRFFSYGDAMFII